MPVTQTAKKALRVSERKYQINQRTRAKLDAAIRIAKKNSDSEQVKNAISLVDRAVKKNIMHKNKAARIKSSLSKLIKSKPKKKKASSKQS